MQAAESSEDSNLYSGVRLMVKSIMAKYIYIQIFKQ